MNTASFTHGQASVMLEASSADDLIAALAKFGITVGSTGVAGAVSGKSGKAADKTGTSTGSAAPASPPAAAAAPAPAAQAAAPAPAPAADVPKYETSGIPEKVKAAVEAGKTTEVKALLTEFGGLKTARELKPEQFADFTAKINALLTPEEALA